MSWFIVFFVFVGFSQSVGLLPQGLFVFGILPYCLPVCWLAIFQFVVFYQQLCHLIVSLIFGLWIRMNHIDEDTSKLHNTDPRIPRFTIQCWHAHLAVLVDMHMLELIQEVTLGCHPRIVVGNAYLHLINAEFEGCAVPAFEF